MHIPVLTYHSTNISGNDYHNNDHIALSSDLNTISQLNITILSAHDLVKWIKGNLELDHSKKYTVLTFDDGVMLDFIDWKHPLHGFQESFVNIMKLHETTIHATAFVIASPDERKILEFTCMAGHFIWGDEWWQDAEDSGLISIENHSWDHLHETLDKVAQKDNLKGDFKNITTIEDAHKQIHKASEYINKTLKNKNTKLFAYPCGYYNDYLIKEYFPKQQDEIIAAFCTDPLPVNQQTNVWKIPRYTCGLNWNSKEQLKSILLT